TARIQREERILRSGLEPYGAYESRTARLVPRIW
ncbi:MAG: hypothetical protein QOK32_647, partial [Gaiellaceae bacterium]|nr:hypothetical protein [Gaiellaceae bacterium]